MKRRQAFVANSSSSSFIILYNYFDVSEILESGVIPEHLNNKIVAYTNKWLCEGQDQIILTKGMIDIINEHYLSFDFIIVNQYVEEEEYTIKEAHVGMKVKDIRQDYHTTGSNLELFVERYVKESRY